MALELVLSGGKFIWWLGRGTYGWGCFRPRGPRDEHHALVLS